jgi:hypothetical protein
MALTNFPNGITSFGVPVIGGINGIPLTGTWYFVNPAVGSDGNEGTSPDSPLATIYRAYSLAVAGNNDVIVLIGNGSTSGTARMSVALAATIDSTATTGTVTWAKNATHLIGVTAPTGVSNRARFAPPTGTYTAATFGNNGNMFNVTASGCIFANFSVYAGFSTGSASQVTWIENGGRNYYENIQFGGFEDSASAGGANARALKVMGTGENTFVSCTIGQDTVQRSAANANLELASATPRNKFINNDFPIFTSSATTLGIIGTGAGSIDRYTKFQSCLFYNAVDSTGTAISAVASLNAAAGGSLVFNNCSAVGATKWGDAGALANSFVDNAPPTAATSGLAVNPS